jgi:hypothetical protein
MNARDYAVLASAVGVAFATGKVVQAGQLLSLGHGLIPTLDSQTGLTLLRLVVFAIALLSLKRHPE